MSEITFIEHIYELRRRLVWIVVSLIVASIIAYQFRDGLVRLVMAPLHGGKLIYLNPGGGFTFIFTICLYVGALVTIPVAIYQLYKFVQPVIGKTSRRLLVGLVSVSSLLAALGVCFGYILVIPGAIHFLGEFAGNNVQATLTTDAYLNFTVMHLFAMALMFQLPLLLFMFDHIRPMPPGTLLKLQRWVIAGSIIAAAVITPTPDPVNLFLVALPIITVYQIGVLVVWLRRRKYHASRKSTHVLPDEAARMQAQHQPHLSLSASKPIHQQMQSAPVKIRPNQVHSQSHVTAISPKTVRRSVDGFGKVVRPKTVIVPARTAPATRPISYPASASRRVPTRGSRVSLDGLSMI